MRVSAVFKGFSSLEKKLKKLENEIDKPALQALGEAAVIIHGAAVRSIQSKDGVKKLVGGREIIVSLPGNPPNTQTGRLVKSIKIVLNKAELTAQVGSNLFYAFYLEFGTSKMAARPWLGPAFQKNKKVIGEIFSRRIKEALKGYGK